MSLKNHLLLFVLAVSEYIVAYKPPSFVMPQIKQCYECSTTDMTKLTGDVKTALEHLTSPRTMADVAVTPQCLDVTQASDENLIHCDGVCMTGVFSMGQQIIWRSCVTITQDCSDIGSDSDSGSTYMCSTETRGNNHIIPKKPTVSPANLLQCYECATIDMTKLNGQVKTSLETLTSPRTMEGVAVSQQCLDVTQLPEENLIDCDGVCLTGIFDIDKKILWRTCVTVTKDCSDIESDPSSGTSYQCSTESRGNNHEISSIQSKADFSVLSVKMNNLEEAAKINSQQIQMLKIEFDEIIQHTNMQCYECSTIDMTLLTSNVKTALEFLTSPRTMDGVDITPQCMDIAASPDAELIDCAGVCLTGIFDVDRHIVWRTCVSVTKDCSDLVSDPQSGTIYDCSSESLGNNKPITPNQVGRRKRSLSGESRRDMISHDLDMLKEVIFNTHDEEAVYAIKRSPINLSRRTKYDVPQTGHSMANTLFRPALLRSKHLRSSSRNLKRHTHEGGPPFGWPDKRNPPLYIFAGKRDQKYAYGA